MSNFKQTRSTCPYCGVGCGVIIESKGDEVVNVIGDPTHPANQGLLCSKGASLSQTANVAWLSSTRVQHPMQRSHKGAPLERVSWTQAIETAAKRFNQIIANAGVDSVGFYVSGQLLTEDYYVFNKLAKGLIGTNNIDTNSRLCMSSAVAAYKKTLGADAPPNCYEDIDHASCIFIAGSNTAFAHPILFRRIERAKANNPNLKIITVDPRVTDTATSSDLHLQILPGTDVALFNGMLYLALWHDWIDRQFIQNHTLAFEKLKETLTEYTPKMVSQICGISEDDLQAAARWFSTSPSTLSLYCQGLNQSSHGTDKNAALINLHLALGQIGKPGAGPFSLTGQPNAMGGREVGGLANLLSGHRDLSNPLHCQEVANLWGVQSVPSKPGKTAVEMFEAAADGEIKALWIACTNPAQSMPDQTTVRRALERCEWVVLQEAYLHTATGAFADLILPATTWAEKEGTVTNSERCISRVRAAVCGPHESKADWRIVVDFARELEHLGIGDDRKSSSLGSLFPYETPESIWLEHRQSTQHRDLDISGLSYEKLELTPSQWPFPLGAIEGKKRLYEDYQFATESKKAQFANVRYQKTAEVTESRYPFALNTGRLRDQWHGMSRTGLVARLFGHSPMPVIELHQQDMERNQWQEGDLLHVTSKRGSIVIAAKSSPQVGINQAFIAMHWGEEFLSGRANNGSPLTGVNALTTSSFCEHSKQPELKHAAVRILKANFAWNFVSMIWTNSSSVHNIRSTLQPLMKRFEHAICVPFGQDRVGLMFQASCSELPPREDVDLIQKILGFDVNNALKYDDQKRNLRRHFLINSHPTPSLEGFMLAGDTQGRSWMKDWLEQAHPVKGRTRELLQGKLNTKENTPIASDPWVCTCIGVKESQIHHRLSSLPSEMTEEKCLEDLQNELKCTTSCGSCKPQVRVLIQKRLSQLPKTLLAQSPNI